LSFVINKRIVFKNDVILHKNLEEKVPIKREKSLCSNGVATILVNEGAPHL